MSQRYQSFLFIVFGFLIVNLFSLNGTLPVWSGAEEASLEGAKELLFEGIPPNFSAAFIGVLDFRWEDKFIIRLPSVLLLLISFLGIYAWGKKIFGKETMITTLVVLASSFLLVNVAKFATSDAWLFCFQIMAVLSLLIYLKQPLKSWNIWHAVFTGLALLIHPVSTLVLMGTLSIFLFIFHPNGKNLKGLFYWFIPLALVAFSFLKGFPNFANHNPFFVSYGTVGIGSYCLLMIYGVLPWFAFLPPGMRHTIKLFRKKEELSIIMLGLFIASVLSMSLVTQFVFAFLITKQIQGLFSDKYPYYNFVKAGAVLHLLIVVMGAMLLMVGGWQELKGLGFRTMMSFGTIYWFASFAGVVGIMMKNRRLILGSAAIAGVMVTFMFWGQIFPLLEAKGMF